MLLMAALVLVTAVASAHAQTRSRADVPFDFVAANKTLPAGNYYIADGTSGRAVVKIAARQEHASVFAMTVAITSKGNTDKGKLVFHRYGNRYFLAEIWTGGDREGQKLLKSREEKAIENEMAMINSKTDRGARSYERVEIALLQK
jgi:hypothetical protein